MKLSVIAIFAVLIISMVFVSGCTSQGASNPSNGTPTMSSMAGTYVEQTSSGTGYNIVLYENGTALFSTYPGTWYIVNSTTLEGTYRILRITRNDYFTITNNGFIAVQTGNVYVKK